MSTGTVYTPPHQLPLFLPTPDANGILTERLARVVAEYEAAKTPGERAELRHEIERLEKLIQPKGAVPRG